MALESSPEQSNERKFGGSFLSFKVLRGAIAGEREPRIVLVTGGETISDQTLLDMINSWQETGSE